MTAHQITLTSPRRINGEPWYVAVCSCGAYRSRLRGYPGDAESAGLEHAKDKTKEAKHG